MKIKFTRAQAQDVIKAVASHAAAKSTIEVVTHIHVAVTPGQMRLTSSDFSIELSALVNVETQDSGAFTVPAKKFASLISSFERDAEIILSHADSLTQMKCGKGRYKLEGLPSANFPFIKFAQKSSFSLPASVLRDIFAYVIPAAAVNDIRFYLNGVNLDMTDPGKIVAIATDGHRMAIATMYGEHAGIDGSILLPRSAVMLLGGLLIGDEVELALADTGFQATCCGYTLTGKQIDGKFPDWKRVRLERPPQANVNRKQLLDAMRRAVLFVKESNAGCTVSISANDMTIKLPNDSCDEAVPLTGGGGDMSASVNLRYLIDAATAGNGELLGISFGKSVNDAILIHESEEKSTVIMPMRL
jgi:DNA polymerase-3 subunit beta